MQDFTGVPAIVDLAAMRDAMADLGGDPRLIEPGIPVDLVIDHSIVADVAGVADAFVRNAELEFARNRERYTFLRWAQSAFQTLRVFPPNRGICHQVNLEYLAQVVFRGARRARRIPTRSSAPTRTRRWSTASACSVGASAASRPKPRCSASRSRCCCRASSASSSSARCPPARPRPTSCSPSPSCCAQHGVVGKFVEFYGEGVGRVPLENRATIGNMSPEYGSTCTIFPVDDETLRYLRATGRPDDLVALVETYAKEQGLWHDPAVRPVYDETISFDLSTVEPSLAGPARPAGSGVAVGAQASFEQALLAFRREEATSADTRRSGRRAPRPTNRRSSRSPRATRPRPRRVRRRTSDRAVGRDGRSRCSSIASVAR